MSYLAYFQNKYFILFSPYILSVTSERCNRSTIPDVLPSGLPIVLCTDALDEFKLRF